MKKEIIFKRPPVEAGTTYFDTANLIKRLDPNDPDWLDKTSKLIKRFCHHEKHSVYSRLHTYRNLDDFEEILESKVYTHSKLYSSLTSEIDNWKV